MRDRLKKIIALALLSLVGSDAFACGVSTQSYVNLAISTAEEKLFSYGIKTIDENLSAAVISNCRETAAKRRFVMITFGPEMTAQDDSIRGTNFDKKFTHNPLCLINNNPLKKIQSPEAMQSAFDSKWKFINECVEVTITEMGPRNLSYPADQEGCKITVNGPKSATFGGGFCFFKPNPESQFNLAVGIKESCKSLAGYKQYGVNLQDLEAGINYYTSSTYKDEINDLSSFGSSTIRLSVNPDNSLFRASDDFGILRPTFPADYPINDVHLGKIQISEQGEVVILKTPLIVNNYCKSVEKNGLKSSICDYAAPYVAEISLINSKGQTEASWYDGGIAPAQWQGIINGEGLNLSKDILKVNQTYKILVSFSDPYFEFNSLKKRIKKRISNLYIRFPELYTGGDISDIPEIGNISNTDLMVEIGGVGEVDFPASINGLGSERKKLGAYYSTSLFPPMYTQACHPETGICQKTGKDFVKFTATFKVNSDYSISNLEVERQSKILGSYKKKITEQPEYICN